VVDVFVEPAFEIKQAVSLNITQDISGARGHDNGTKRQIKRAAYRLPLCFDLNFYYLNRKKSRYRNSGAAPCNPGLFDTPLGRNQQENDEVHSM
jgi:hypothetical protein